MAPKTRTKEPKSTTRMPAIRLILAKPAFKKGMIGEAREKGYIHF